MGVGANKQSFKCSNGRVGKSFENNAMAGALSSNDSCNARIKSTENRQNIYINRQALVILLVFDLLLVVLEFSSGSLKLCHRSVVASSCAMLRWPAQPTNRTPGSNLSDHSVVFSRWDRRCC